MPNIVYSQHTWSQMPDRGAAQEEIEATIQSGERVQARRGRTAFRKNFTFQQMWKGRYFETKQVMPIVKKEDDTLIVITVYVFYFGGTQ